MGKQQSEFAKARLNTRAGSVGLYRLAALEQRGFAVGRLPNSIKVLLEAALRQVDGLAVTEQAVATIAGWSPQTAGKQEIPFLPARVVMQDFTGVPAVVDLAALRSAAARLGADPKKVNPKVPVDLVIDHSVQVDQFGSSLSLAFNAEREFERNRERYEFLKWGQQAFANFRVVPPATGIVHQVNLEYLAQVVCRREVDGEWLALPDSLVGTDSHTTMINGLGVVGWGVGGIEAEAVMLGQPIYMLLPEVVGFRLDGRLPAGATATDLVLMITQMLRAQGVVGKFVEFYGSGLASLSLPDRATIANMAPEYGATMGFFPVDEETLAYLRLTGRDSDTVDLVERYSKEQGLFAAYEAAAPDYNATLKLDLGEVEPALAGPKRPQDRVPLKVMAKAFDKALTAAVGPKGFGLAEADRDTTVELAGPGVKFDLGHGSVVIAAITSCTNTSNPSVLIAAGLLAKKAVERGLSTKPWVKTSFAPGSKVVSRYLEQANLTPYLDALRFQVVGYGCTTCIGNSGPLPEPIRAAISEGGLVAASVLSGNRNFEGRINPDTRANYLASPPLVVAYALAGRVDIDLTREPIGHDPNGLPVLLSDLWPSQEEIRAVILQHVRPEDFAAEYANVFDGNPQWNAVPVPASESYQWDANSTYIQEPPFFQGLSPEPEPIAPIRAARVLAWMPDSTTTDHISPAGDIAEDSPAGRYLTAHGVSKPDFNSYGSRRGNHEVMMRGTLANIRIKNKLLPGVEGGMTLHIPSGERLAIWDAAERYLAAGTDLIVLAGKEYGTGSSRDWAAKGVALQGVRAVIAESFERIHRSNLVGMGVLPLQFLPGQDAAGLGLTGLERYDVAGLGADLVAGQKLEVRATADDGRVTRFEVVCRIDTPVEVSYYANGGILQAVLRQMIKG
jgi:aconitate hydratase